jgi:hypothetical protein
MSFLLVRNSIAQLSQVLFDLLLYSLFLSVTDSTFGTDWGWWTNDFART